MWKILYDGIFQSITRPWNELNRIYPECGRVAMDHFRMSVYFLNGMILIAVTGIVLIVYYIWLNNRFGRFYSKGKYFLFMVANALIVLLLSFLIPQMVYSKSITCIVWGDYLVLGLINAIYSMIIFFLFSFVLQHFSVMGKFTPFKTIE